MKKGIVAVMLLAMMFWGGVPLAYAGIGLEGEVSYGVGDMAIGSYTQVAVDLAPDPFDLSLTWRRDWMPDVENSLLLDAGISLGLLRLGYEKEMLEWDVGIASLTLTRDPFTFGYTRVLDGEDPGTYTLRFEWSI